MDLETQTNFLDSFQAVLCTLLTAYQLLMDEIFLALMVLILNQSPCLKMLLASIYGARAANGVIVVETKSGISGKGKVNYSTQVGFSLTN